MPLAVARKEQTAIVKPVSLRYDYSQLPIDIRTEARELAEAIYGKIDEAGFAVYDLGMFLKQQKDLLGHGYWLPWLQNELGWDDRRAQLLMSIPTRWPDRKAYEPVMALSTSVQQLLAAPSTPEEAVEVIIEASTSNGGVTVKEAKVIIADVKAEQAQAKGFVPAAKAVLDYESTLDVLRKGIAAMTVERAYSFLSKARQSDFYGYVPGGTVLDGQTFEQALAVIRGEVATKKAEAAAPAVRVVRLEPTPIVAPASKATPLWHTRRNHLANAVSVMLENSQHTVGGESPTVWINKLVEEGMLISETLEMWRYVQENLETLQRMLGEIAED